jgi:myo-inositol-1(or 4)-monophosphatase
MSMLEIAKIAAKAAGKIILSKFKADISFEQKADKTFVSEVDKEAEKEIRKIIQEKYPEHTINGEEFGQSGESTIIWHVDPLDGTTAFKNKIPYSCVSIGIQKDGEFIIGVIYNPYTNSLFYAEVGKGAFLNGEKIKVNDLSLMEGVCVFNSSFRGDRVSRKIKTLEQFTKKSSRFRMVISSALKLTEVANGNCVVALLDTIHTYDFAAGIVIVVEAGGIVTDQYGQKPTRNSKVIIAGNNKENHQELINLTKENYKDYKGQ